MKTIIVTSSHEWNDSRKFVITIDGNKTKICYYEDDKYIKIHDFTSYLNLLFEMFGCMDELCISGGNYTDVYKVIYNIKIPPKYKFINMSKLCGRKYGSKMPISSCKIIKLRTFYDFVKRFGILPSKNYIKYLLRNNTPCDFNGKKYYEYPDGMYCRIKDVIPFGENHFVEVYFER